jgi:hypothetical protein
MRIVNVSAIIALAACSALPSFAQLTGPSTSQTPYVLPVSNWGSSVKTLSLISNGPTVGMTVGGTPYPGTIPTSFAGDETYPLLGGAGSYRLAGIPDGMGAVKNVDGSFDLFVNHELGASVGAVRAHGSRGAFISQWRIQPNGTVIGGKDAITNVNLWNIAGGAYQNFNTATPMPKYSQGGVFGAQGWDNVNPSKDGIGRLCSADLPAVSAFSFGALGTTERLFMNGEEIGQPGRAFATVVSGPNAGTMYELPRLGDFSWENSVASPKAQAKTVVLGLDDTTPGQLYLYVGDKTASGSEVDRAGLTNGVLYGVKVPTAPVASGASIESRSAALNAGKGVPVAFTTHLHGDTTAVSGVDLDASSRTNGVTDFLRPEDGAWDPRPGRENDFYFVTTDRFNTPSQVGRSRLWKMVFTDIANPQAGGSIIMLMDGTEGQQMFDNMTIDSNGRIVIQEDPGNQAYLARTWIYDTSDGRFGPIAQFDAARFGGPTFPFNQDEESSGIIPAFDLLGDGWYLGNVQAHYGFDVNGLVEGGQIYAMYIDPTLQVPEPSALALIAVPALGLVRRRSRR